MPISYVLRLFRVLLSIPFSAFPLVVHAATAANAARDGESAEYSMVLIGVGLLAFIVNHRR
jgi:hypothetical protein